MNDQQRLEQLKTRIAQYQMDWLERFDERQQNLIANCRLYASNTPAGLPGHNLMIIIAKMADLLDDEKLVEPDKIK